MSFTADTPSTEDVLAAVLGSSTPPLPPQEQHLRATLVSWWETTPGEVYIHAEGGTVDDRHYARTVVALELEPHGYRRAQFDLDDIPRGRVSSWPDIMAKAKRLIQSGQVHVLRNGFNYIIGHVIGDHGEYDTEISRDDPNSRAITGWQCSCPWDQYAWQRTRKWKKFEGRPCFLPGSLVTSAYGQYEVIDEIAPDLHLLTHDGVGRVINRWDNYYSGRVLSIKRASSPFAMQLTEDHKVYANVAAREHPRTGAGWYRESKAVRDPERWGMVEARNLQVGDWLKAAYPTEELPFVIDLMERFPLLRGHGEGDRVRTSRGKHALDRYIEPSHALATVIGYFLSEGNVENYYKGVPSDIAWTFHVDEIEAHDELRSALAELGAGDTRFYSSENRATIKLANGPLAQLLVELCGSGATSKQLAPELMVAPKDFQRAMLSAYVIGDGHIRDTGFAVNTASEILARQLILLGCRLYNHVPRVGLEMNAGGPTQREKRFASYRIVMNQTKMHGRVRLEEGYYAVRISEITESMYDGPVYDLNVDHQHTYAVEDNCVSNCAHVMALYWKALSTPMDEQLTPEQAQAMGTGQTLPAAPVPEHAPGREPGTPHPDTHEMALPRSFGPEGDIIQGDQQQLPMAPDALGGPPGPAQAPLAPPPQGPTPPGILPPFPGEQMEMEWAGPGTTPGGGVSPPGAYSVPGAKPPNMPPNPLQNPGTYSKTAADFQPPQVVRLKNDVVGLAEGPVKGQYGDGEYREVPAVKPNGQPTLGEVRSQDPSTGWVEVAIPLDDSGPHEPFHVLCFLEPGDIEPTSQSNAFIRRHR